MVLMRKPDRRNLIPILVRLTEFQHKKLKEINKESDVPISSLVRLSVTEYLNKEPKL